MPELTEEFSFFLKAWNQGMTNGVTPGEYLLSQGIWFENYQKFIPILMKFSVKVAKKYCLRLTAVYIMTLSS